MRAVTALLAILLCAGPCAADGINNSGSCTISGSTITCPSGSLTPGSGSVTTVSVTTANGVSGVVANPTTTPAITITLGAITPTSVAASAASSVNLNTASLMTPITGTALQVAAADGATGRISVDSFGAIGAFTCRRADGTGASPTAVQSGDQLCGINAYTYVTTASPGYVGPVASYQTFATQNHTTTAQGSKAVIATTPNNSTTLTTAVTINQDQSVVLAGTLTTAPSGTVGIIFPTNSSNSAEFYNTADQVTNFERLTLAWSSNIAMISTTKGGTGTSRSLQLNGANTLLFSVGGGTSFTINANDMFATNAAGSTIRNIAASSTVPTLISNRADTTTGIGAQASGNVSVIAGGVEQMRVAASGSLLLPLLVQTATAQSGTVCYNSGTGAITYDATVGCLTSTLTEKEDWQDITPQEALAVVLKMQAGSYTYKVGRGLPKGPQIGLAAEQLADIDDRLVGHRPDGTLQGVRYSQASALYPMAIQALQAEIETMKVRQ